MSELLHLPRRAAASTAAAVTAPLRPLLPPHAVDEWGRDDHLVRLLQPLSRLRWQTTVGGEHHVPAHRGALLVTNRRRWSASPLYVAWALSHRLDRPVRFVGRPDSAPFGPALRRVGALLQHPTEVQGALRHGELVVLGAAPTSHPRHAGPFDPELVAAAVLAGVAVLPVASMSSPSGRAARVEVGAPLRSRVRRRGPLAEVELAEAAQHQLQTMLDELGGMHTGMPIDWLAEG